MASETQRTQTELDECGLRRVVFAAVGIVTAAFVSATILYAHHGRPLLDRLESIEPTTVFMRGMQLDRQGHIEEAMASYQRSLDLGLNWPASVANCKKRLERLRGEHGQTNGR